MVGYEGLYEISNLGNVVSLNYRQSGKIHLLKKSMNTKGYNYVSLSKWDGSGGKLVRVTRLVAMAFLPNPNNLPEIDHINAVRTDDAVENLRWCSHVDNCNNKISIGRHIACNGKSVAKYTTAGELIGIYASIADAARTISVEKYKAIKKQIARQCRGEFHKCHGYIWRFCG